MAESTLRDTQYRPISTSETSANDGLSVRFARDAASGINNARSRVMAPVLNDAWPGQLIYDTSNDTDEHVLIRYPAVWVGPDGFYNLATWSACGYKASGSNNCALRLYSSQHRYDGPDTITAAMKSTLGSYDSDAGNITATYTSTNWVHSKETLAIHPNNYETYFLLTAKFAAASASNGVYLLSLSITLAHETADIL